MSSSARTLILGHFGSGKTEVAVHLALSLAKDGVRPVLVDLDFITPFYRSRDLAAELAVAGVDVVAPEGALGRSDLPVVSSRAVSALLNHPGPVVADIGGDEGTRALGSLSGLLQPRTYEALMVVNPYRPGTGTADQVFGYAHWLQQMARISLTGLVNNANLGPLTEPWHVLEGLTEVQRAADLLQLPVCFSAARSDVAAQLAGVRVLPLELKMRPPWELGMV